ncbi:glutathione S-transferase domain-containing protein [Exophiala viscosa]|uniref:glutathione S-transferase domain-containing protein n=1 Tax=Exophiala viscosa TaxID=2486360 RepID=UPI002193CF5D|nr:glutathione S-transferase domain-containing protein [Exophiala viscosa]
MVLKLISATPSPYARKVRIALAEKSIPFELVTEVPWDKTTQTPQYNPLEKLPVLIDTEAKDPEDGSVYESHFILDWIEYKYRAPEYVSLTPDTRDGELFAKKVQVIADGVCDACVLMFFEKQRSSPSEEWTSRQRRKVDGGLKQLAKWAGDKEFLLDDKFTMADVAAGCVLGYLRVRFAEHPWQETYPNLKRYSDGLEARKSFKDTVPTPQDISDKIV